MRILVTIVSPDPPVGRVTSCQHREPTAFVGWLGLIRLLVDAVESDRETNASNVEGTGAGGGTSGS